MSGQQNISVATKDKSILDTIKKLLLIPIDHTEFDDQIILHINTILLNLHQMGVGKEGGLTIQDNTSTWGDFFTDLTTIDQSVTYVYIKVRLIFDPPANSYLVDCYERQARELEVRLYTETGGY